MNLLIIGNGLDLDLKLPTKYSDFLKFSKSFTFFFDQDIEKIYEFDIHNHSVVDSRYDKKSISPNLNEPYKHWKEILEKFDESFSHKFINKACKDFFYCVHNNCWIKYFNERYQKHLIAGENWIDIENEIQNVIRTLEDKNKFKITDEKNQASIGTKANYTDNLNIQEIINELSSGYLSLFVKDYKKFKGLLLKDYDKFVMALGIYLDFFVSQLPLDVNHASQQLQNMLLNENHPIIDHVLSFNYINNFANEASLQHTCFVHGKINYMAELKQYISDDMSDGNKMHIKIENIIQRNKIIIGFDDLQDEEESFELEFVDYRKYFQRIYKGTDSQYVDWLNGYKQALNGEFSFQQARTSTFQNQHSNLNYENFLAEKIQNSKQVPNQVFIFGHSLDATDNEIFKDIFLREFNDTKITIYYHSADDRKRIITNLIKILTKPVLVQKTKGTNPDIKFIAQTYNS